MPSSKHTCHGPATPVLIQWFSSSTDQRFLSIALGSNAELRTQLYIARRIGVIEQTNLETLITEAKQISAMLNGLRKSLKPKLTKN